MVWQKYYFTAQIFDSSHYFLSLSLSSSSLSLFLLLLLSWVSFSNYVSCFLFLSLSYSFFLSFQQWLVYHPGTLCTFCTLHASCSRDFILGFCHFVRHSSSLCFKTLCCHLLFTHPVIRASSSFAAFNSQLFLSWPQSTQLLSFSWYNSSP